nr:hypothetical protein BaRGS_025964 [Batillaria attramentaria]
MVKMSTDLVFVCPTRNATRNIRSHGVKDVWLYVWDHAFSFPGWGHVTYCEGRVCHGSELVYLFHTEWAGGFKFTADEEVLSSQIMDFWANFAKRGNPNSFGATRQKSSAVEALNWPAYSSESSWSNYRFKAPTSEIEVKYHGYNCDFWDTIGYAA